MRCAYCSFTCVENILANDVCSCFAHLSRGGLRFHRHGSVVESLACCAREEQRLSVANYAQISSRPLKKIGRIPICESWPSSD